MRMLFLTGGGAAPVHATAPLAWAARTAGHDVLVGVPQENVDLVAGLGLPATIVTELGMGDAMLKDREGRWLPMPSGEESEMDFAGRGFARLAAASLPGTRSVVEAWKPDVVIGGEYTLVAGLVAHRYDIPWVAQTWAIYDRTDVDWRGALDELRPEAESVGLTDDLRWDMLVDVTPPSLRPAHADPCQPIRWTPGNSQVPLAPWMLTSDGRRRVVLTSGSRSMFVPTLGADFFRPLLQTPLLRRDDVEVVVATSEAVAAQLREEFPGVRAGFVPLDVIAPTSDVVLHHGGGVTVMTLLNAGTPQVVLPEIAASALPLAPVDAAGASLTLGGSTAPTADLEAALGRVLDDASFGARAKEISAEIATLPPAHDVVSTISELAFDTSRLVGVAG